MTTRSPRTSFTPLEMIALLSLAFVTGPAEPAIDQNGNPEYPLSTERKGWGCAASTLAYIRPEFFERLRGIGLHQVASARDLPSKGIPIGELLTGELTGRYRGCTGEEFIQFLQNVHDDAAREYHRRLTRRNPMPRDVALIAFRYDFLTGLTSVLDGLNRNWEDLAQTISTLRSEAADNPDSPLAAIAAGSNPSA